MLWPPEQWKSYFPSTLYIAFIIFKLCYVQSDHPLTWWLHHLLESSSSEMLSSDIKLATVRPPLFLALLMVEISFQIIYLSPSPFFKHKPISSLLNCNTQYSLLFFSFHSSINQFLHDSNFISNYLHLSFSFLLIINQFIHDSNFISIYLLLSLAFLIIHVSLSPFGSPLSLSIYPFLIINQFLQNLFWLVRKAHVIIVLLVQAALLRSLKSKQQNLSHMEFLYAR